MSWEARRGPLSRRTAAHNSRRCGSNAQWRRSATMASLSQQAGRQLNPREAAGRLSWSAALSPHLQAAYWPVTEMTLKQGGARQRRRERPQTEAAAAAANISCHASAPAFGFGRTDKLNTQAGKHTQWRQSYSTHETEGQSWWSASC